MTGDGHSRGDKFSEKRDDSRESQTDDDVAYATAVGRAAMNFFRLFLVAILNEGLLPGFSITRNDSLGSASSNATGSVPVMPAVLKTPAAPNVAPAQLGGNAPPPTIHVPNYCRPDIPAGPWYVVFRGLRVGLYNHADDAYAVCAGISNNFHRRYTDENEARNAFIAASIAQQVIEFSNDNRRRERSPTTFDVNDDNDPLSDTFATFGSCSSYTAENCSSQGTATLGSFASGSGSVAGSSSQGQDLSSQVTAIEEVDSDDEYNDPDYIFSDRRDLDDFTETSGTSDEGSEDKDAEDDVSFEL